MFAHLLQIEYDYIHKNICLNTNQYKAEIALVCISYLISGNIINIFYKSFFKY